MTAVRSKKTMGTVVGHWVVRGGQNRQPRWMFSRFCLSEETVVKSFAIILVSLVFLLGCSAPKGAIHDAVRDDNVELMKSLLNNSPRLVNAKEDGGVTPLHLASGFGYQEMVEILLAHQAHVNVKDKDGQTPLYWAARRGHRQIVVLLLAYGAEANTRDNAGESAAQAAAKWGFKTIVQLLAEHHVEDAVALLSGKVLESPKRNLVTITAAESAPSVPSADNTAPANGCGCGGAK